MSTILRLNALSDERLDVFARLTEHQLKNAHDAERGIFIAESRLVVEVALSSGVGPCLSR